MQAGICEYLREDFKSLLIDTNPFFIYCDTTLAERERNEIIV